MAEARAATGTRRQVSCSPPIIWISRPRGRAQQLAQALRTCGMRPLLRPAMKITAPPARQALMTYLRTVDSFSVSVFVSADAAKRVAAVLPPGKPLAALAVGMKTAATLSSRFRLAESPSEVVGDSRVLARAACLQTPGKVAVLGGVSDVADSPAPWLCAQIRARGGEAYPVVCYRRMPMPPDETVSTLGQRGTLAAAIAYSGDSLRYMEMMTAPDNDWLRRLPLFVIHRNIARIARTRGFQRVIVAEDTRMAERIAAMFGDYN